MRCESRNSGNRIRPQKSQPWSKFTFLRERCEPGKICCTLSVAFLDEKEGSSCFRAGISRDNCSISGKERVQGQESDSCPCIPLESTPRALYFFPLGRKLR